MSLFRHHARIALAALALLTTALPGLAEGHWSPSWAASPQPLWGPDFVLPTGLPERFEPEITLRQAARLSIGGRRLRVVISNEYGREPLMIGAASLGLDAGGSAVAPQSLRPLSFGGRRELRLAPGERIASDPVALALPALARVSVSLYLPRASRPAGFHFDARETVYLAAGDHSAAPALPAQAQRLSARAYLSELQVETEAPARSVITLGDSLTDGNGATPGADTRWPDALAERLAGRGVAVLNAGISGNRLLRDGMGDSGLTRAAREVFARPGRRSLVVLLGVNDLGWPGGAFAPAEPQVEAETLIDGYRRLIAAARAQGVHIVGATIPPLERALAGTPLEGHHSPDKERRRQQVNAWIRSAGAFDAVLDFDAALRDPARPQRLLPAYDSGDHLHPGDAGYRAMAAAVDLDTLLPD
ncbi:SGNH/GDSL hydrolase family protein [Roseateles sp. DAIF2]|uniref:SGNH/GDSL hydrolase family protein n=1 Tax=Roseateles sp. DAIF2 TaxID=2714952 RepID=UPI0018A26617|nr:SGNH/GDSL hydrolase family protein [Roseateles sp. DAIF2]QPF73057.1 SGNH/GDSL hydrolase family protein [Roseateles sp. DAIF2]